MIIVMRLLVGGVATAAVGIRSTGIERNIFAEIVSTVDGIELVLLVIGHQLAPICNLVGTPQHTVGEEYLVIPVHWRNLSIGGGIAQVRVVLRQPCGIDAAVAGVHIILCLILIFDEGEQRAASVLPLGYHHILQFVGRVHEGGGDAIAHRQGIFQVELEWVVVSFAEEAELAACADNDVGGCTDKDIA